jgi:hypothetical protein
MKSITSAMKPCVTLVTPVFNEEENLTLYRKRVKMGLKHKPGEDKPAASA